MGLLAVLACAPAASANVVLAGNERGDAVAVTQARSNLIFPVRAAIREAGGRFGSPAVLVSGTRASDVAAAMGPGGHAVVAWVEYQASLQPTALKVALREPGGGFGQPATLSTSFAGILENVAPRVAINSTGEAVVSWVEMVDGARRFAYATRTAGGGFSAPAAAPFGAGGGQFGIDDAGEVLFAYTTFGGDRFRLHVTTRPRGGGFGPPQDVSAPLESIRSSDFEVRPDGRALLGWAESDPGDGPARVMAAVRAPGATFGAPAEVASGERVTTQLQARLAGSGEAVFAWSIKLDGLERLRAASRSAEGVASAPITLGRVHERPFPLLRFSLAADSRGDAAVVWRERTNAVKASYRPTGGGFDAARVLAPAQAPPIGTYDTPGAVVSGDGRATAAFERSSGERVKALARSFDSARLGGIRSIGSERAYMRELPRSKCFPRNSRTLAASRIARVFLRREAGFQIVYGCLFARGRPVEISSNFGRPAPVALRGPLVAHGWGGCTGDDCNSLLDVVDLRDESAGLNRVVVAAEDDLVGFGAVVLRGSGAVAWVTCDENVDAEAEPRCPRRGSKYRVHRLAAGSERPKLLSSGRRIDPFSLRLRGSRLTWRDGSRVRASTLR